MATVLERSFCVFAFWQVQSWNICQFLMDITWSFVCIALETLELVYLGGLSVFQAFDVCCPEGFIGTERMF